MYSLRPHSPHSAPAALLAAAAMALTLTACSPSTPSPARQPAASPAASTASDSSAVPGAVSDADSSTVRDAYDLKLAQCIRSKGVNVKDPQPGHGITETGPGVQAAASACSALLPPPLMTSTEEKQVRGIYLKMAACLRKRGYDVADPAPDQAIALTNDIPQSDVKDCESAK